MRGRRDGAGLSNFSFNPFAHLNLKIGRGQGYHSVFGLQQDIGQNRNGIASLDNALHMVERFEKGTAFNCGFHPTLFNSESTD